MAQKKGIGIFLAAAFLGVMILLCMVGKADREDAVYRELLEKETAKNMETDSTDDADGVPSTEEGNLRNEISGNAASAQKASLEDEQDKNMVRICAYVCGRVKNPGIYTLSEGARLSDFISEAGGFSKRAAKEYLNLAEKAEDGQRIYVPSKKEVKKQSEQSKTLIESQESFGTQPTWNEKVNINVAKKEELMTLTGIGEAKANAIINYREEHGGFGAVEELMQISGIKEGVYRKICDFITI